MRVLLLLALIFTAGSQVIAQNEAADKEAAYTKTITSRSEKIVAALQLEDSAKFKRVVTILTGQYRNLNKVYTERDKRIELLEAARDSDTTGLKSQIKTAEEAYWAEAQKLHKPFLSALAKELTPDQVTKVKDGMTYNVLNVTYKAMLEMIPSLKTEEKTQIMTWLVEARELAMDAESSDKKHWWFGKYKGRINNYLAAQGYDLQKERKAWEERLKAEKEKKDN